MLFLLHSHLKESNDDGAHHDKHRVEHGPEDERDGQAAHLCKLLYVCEGSKVKERSAGRC